MDLNIFIVHTISVFHICTIAIKMVRVVYNLMVDKTTESEFVQGSFDSHEEAILGLCDCIVTPLRYLLTANQRPTRSPRHDVRPPRPPPTSQQSTRFFLFLRLCLR